MKSKSSWLSLHVHYNSDPHWLLKEGVAPAIRALRERELVSQYFFIRYWEQGPHVRLRLQTSAEKQHESCEVAQSIIGGYLRRRPSVFRFPTRHMPPSFSQLFVAEYGEQELHRKYGESGQIPFAENNHIAQVAYSPEYSRYGGEHGVTMAERHFQVSSDHVLRCLAMENGHDFRVILGRGYRLMLCTCLALLPARTDQFQFLESYQRQWNALIGSLTDVVGVQFGRKYKASKAALDCSTKACLELAEGLVEGRPEERDWFSHVENLRHELENAFAEGLLQLPDGINTIEQAIHYLIPGYIHMTNNRLGISIADEVYMAYIMHRSLNDNAS